MSGSAGNSRWERVRAALGVYKVVIKKRRTATGARVMQQLQQRLLDQQRDVVVGVMQAVAADDNDVRRQVERARGKWRGSTIAGLMRGDEGAVSKTRSCATRGVSCG